MTKHNDLVRGTRIGIGAAMGHVAGVVGKLALAFVIAGLALSMAIFR